MAQSNIHQLYKANDEISLISTISHTEVIAKKMELYVGLAKEPDVREFFQQRAILMKKKADDMRKHLDRIGGA